MLFNYFAKKKIQHQLDELLADPANEKASIALLESADRKKSAFEAVMCKHAKHKGWFFSKNHDDREEEGYEHRKARMEKVAEGQLKWTEFVRVLKQPKSGPRQKWEDSTSNRFVDPLLLQCPKSLEEIQDLVKSAKSKGVKVRAYGSKHSVSDVAISTDYMVYTGGFGYPLALDRSLLKKEAAEDKTLFETQAGITIKELTFALEHIDLALPNMGGSNVQTFLGACSTGTHGSGVELGNYADLIQSLVIVASEGKTYRVEPTEGISEPSSYPKDGIELIQDDDKFYSTIVSMGSMGIVYSVVLKVVPFYYLAETRTMSTWSELKEKLNDGSMVGEYRDFEVLINPFIVKGENNLVVVKRDDVGGDLGSVTPSGHRNYLESLLSKFKFTTEILITIMNLFPKEVPKLIEKGIKGQVDHDYKDKWYNVLNQGLNQVKNFGTAIEIGFPVEKVGENQFKPVGDENHPLNYVAGTEEIMKLIQGMAGEETRQYVSSPISLRFVKKSKAYMAPMYEQYTCMIEVPILHKVYGNFQIIERVERAMLARGCRMHWGLNMDELNTAQVAALYPKTPEFIETLKFFNHDGTFDNAFTHRVGFTS